MLLKLEDYMLPCLTKKYLGFECMGCGLQRSVALLLRGEFVDAFFMYPAIYFLLPLFVTAFTSLFYKKPFITKMISVFAVLSVATIIISFTIELLIK